MLSYKNLFLLSVSAFYKKIVVPTSKMEHLNVTFLLTNATKKGGWVGHTFPQKPRSFKFLSILEENCGADIINGTFKCKTFVFLLSNAAKKGRWVGYTFPQKPKTFKFLSISEENCGADIINVTFKCKTFVNEGSKTCSWVSYTFLQKPCSFKRFSILEENCLADIINVTFTVNVRILLTKAPKLVLGWVILSCKSLVLLSVSAF